MGSGPDTLIRGPIKNTVYVFADVVGSVKMLITFKGKSMWNGPYKLFHGFENGVNKALPGNNIRFRHCAW